MKLIDQWHYNWLEDYLKRNPDDFVVGQVEAVDGWQGWVTGEDRNAGYGTGHGSQDDVSSLHGLSGHALIPRWAEQILLRGTTARSIARLGWPSGAVLWRRPRRGARSSLGQYGAAVRRNEDVTGSRTQRWGRCLPGTDSISRARPLARAIVAASASLIASHHSPQLCGSSPMPVRASRA